MLGTMTARAIHQQPDMDRFNVVANFLCSEAVVVGNTSKGERGESVRSWENDILLCRKN